MYNVIKKTYFRKRWDGSKQMLRNWIVDSAICPKVAKIFLEEEIDYMKSCGMLMLKRTDTMAVFSVGDGSIINVRMV